MPHQFLVRRETPKDRYACGHRIKTSKSIFQQVIGFSNSSFSRLGSPKYFLQCVVQSERGGHSVNCGFLDLVSFPEENMHGYTCNSVRCRLQECSHVRPCEIALITPHMLQNDPLALGAEKHCILQRFACGSLILRFY